MPASAVIDSEDDEPAGGGGSGTLGGGGGTSSGLAAIDITTPLEEDEIMPEVKPYVVSEPSQPEAFALEWGAELVACVGAVVVVVCLVLGRVVSRSWLG